MIKKLLLSLVIITSGVCFGESSTDIEIAKARAKGVFILNSINESNPIIKPPVAEPPVAEPPVTEPPVAKKPLIYITYASFNCPPCEDLKSKLSVLKSKGLINDLPFEISVTNKPPVNPVHYPFVVWKNSNGAWIYLDNWIGLNDLIERWKYSQEPTANSKVNNNKTSGVSTYTPVYTWPGDLRFHLENTHNANTANMTQDQLEMLHDRLHGVFN